MPKGRRKGTGARPRSRLHVSRAEEKRRRERWTIVKWLAIFMVFLMVASIFVAMNPP